MQNQEKGCAAAVMLVAPEGILLVMDPYQKKPLYWKLPGGRGEWVQDPKSGDWVFETPEQCAVREMKEETGVDVSPSEFTLVFQEDRGNHIFTIFRVNRTVMPEWKLVGVEDEGVNVYTPQQILALHNFLFLPGHMIAVGKIIRQLASA